MFGKGDLPWSPLIATTRGFVGKMWEFEWVEGVVSGCNAWSQATIWLARRFTLF